MAKATGLNATGKKLTNHSVRKTAVQKLQIQDIPNSHIATITGHHNEQSLCSMQRWNSTAVPSYLFMNTP